MSYELFDKMITENYGPTAFSCKDDGEDYGVNFLMSRPIPWVVRVYFKMEDSMKGILCSGKGCFHFHLICPIFWTPTLNM